MPGFKDLTGQRFDKLTVERLARKAKKGKRYRYYWLCKCQCGNTVEVRTDCLTSGLVRSCGCIKKEQDKKNLTANHSHKLSHTPLWEVYSDMKSRCHNRNDHSFPRYGGRGIVVCDEWKDDSNKFFEWALSNGYKTGLQIDRIDNEKGYSPENCRWVTPKENCRNRRSNVMIEHEGELITLIELSERLGIPYRTAYSRYRKYCTRRSDL